MNDIFNDKNELKSSWIKFSSVGDHVFGTLIAVREVMSNIPGKASQEMVKVYEIKVDGGEFHDIDENKKVIETPIKLNAGDIWNVGGGFMLDGQMRNIKIGQKIGIKYTADKPNKQKGFNPMKIKKVYSEGKMDTEWLENFEKEQSLKGGNF